MRLYNEDVLNHMFIVVCIMYMYFDKTKTDNRDITVTEPITWHVSEFNRFIKARNKSGIQVISEFSIS